jgi:signal transduction histidine kinase
MIASRVKRLSAMIDAILAYSRAGRAGSDRVAVDLGPLVRNTIELLAPPPHISVEVNGELPALKIEAVKIQQVFLNLLSNAIDFMDKPAGRIVVRAHHADGEWHFSVADNGPGIESRHCERVFQLFQTLSARDDVERTGVGLALVRKIVELEGGRAWIESEAGSGTTVHFTLPGDRATLALFEEAA